MISDSRETELTAIEDVPATGSTARSTSIRMDLEQTDFGPSTASALAGPRFVESGGGEGPRAVTARLAIGLKYIWCRTTRPLSAAAAAAVHCCCVFHCFFFVPTLSTVADGSDQSTTEPQLCRVVVLWLSAASPRAVRLPDGWSVARGPLRMRPAISETRRNELINEIHKENAMCCCNAGACLRVDLRHGIVEQSGAKTVLFCETTWKLLM